MKILLGVLFALALGLPAAAQDHKRTALPTPAQIMATATADALKAFGIAPEGGLRHLASGYRCPYVSAGIVLTAIGTGSPPGLTSEQGAWCEYSDQAGPVARLSISRDPRGAPALSAGFCRGLPKALKLKMGPGIIPGIGKTVGPAQQEILPTLQVAGEVTPLWRCSTIREPYNVPTVVADTSALRTPNGWTLRAIHTPAPPPCCNSYRELMSFTFFILPVILIVQATGSDPSALPGPPEIIDLKPGEP